MDVKEHPIQHYVKQIEADRPFAFIRYGNGEWDCIMKTFHRTRSGSQVFSPALRRELVKSITFAYDDARYWPALRPSSFNNVPQVVAWLTQNTPSHVKWQDCRSIHKASKGGKFYPFIRQMRRTERRLIVVGPKFLTGLQHKVFNGRKMEFVLIPPKNGFTQFDSVLDQLEGAHNAIVLVSAGPMAKPLIWHMWDKHSDSFWIDCGSVWDIYCGVKSRQYHKRMEGQTIRRNLKG